MVNQLKRELIKQYFAEFIKFILAVTFILASLSKIAAPESFLRDIENYQIVPLFFINFTAIFLPWLEFLIALFLIIGYKKRAALIIIIALLLVFIVALGYNIFRGADFDCGCFGAFLKQNIFQALIKNLILIAAALYLFFRERENERG